MIKEDKQNVRISLLSIFVILIFLVFIIRIINLVSFPSENLARQAKKQYKGFIKLSEQRGQILDSKGTALAITISSHSLYADPSLIDKKDKKLISKNLSKHLNISYKRILSKIENKRRFVWLKRKLDDLEYEKIKDIVSEHRGLQVIKEAKREYPNNTLASHIIGFVDIDGKGLSGVELFYNDFLRGEKSKYKINYQRDAKGRVIYDDKNIFKIQESASSLYLTIDSSIQYQVESILKSAQEQLDAKSITAIVLNPNSGEIISLANIPTYDLNNPGGYSFAKRRNRAITDVYEPGSTFKIFPVAIALQEKFIKSDTKIWCENGQLEVDGQLIREANFHKFEWLSIYDIIAKSSNIGTAKIAFKIGFERFLTGISDIFGIGKETGIDLPGEVRGILHKEKNKIMLASMSFGQGLAVTPMQMVKAYASIANGGFEVNPHLVKKVMANDKNIFIRPSEMKGRRVLEEQVSNELKSMLSLVVKEGTGIGTNLQDFEVAGKTGTAQKSDIKKGGYYKDKYILSFAGFFPVEDPQFTVIVVVDEPKKGKYASTVAVPIFRRISNVLLQNTENKIKDLKISKDLTSVVNKTRFRFDLGIEKISLVPDFTGKTLREVLVDIKAPWKDVFVSGTGTVYKQKPVPSTKYKKDTVLQLYLK